MAQWYRVAGETKLNAFEVKVAAAVGRLQGRTDGEFIRLATPCSNPDEGLQVLREHIEALIKNS